MAKKGFKNIDIKQLEDDTEIYSSKHYIYGELIVKCWRDFMKAKADEIKAKVLKDESGPGSDGASPYKEREVQLDSFSPSK
jgi:hypothetical protein